MLTVVADSGVIKNDSTTQKSLTHSSPWLKAIDSPIGPFPGQKRWLFYQKSRRRVSCRRSSRLPSEPWRCEPGTPDFCCCFWSFPASPDNTGTTSWKLLTTGCGSGVRSMRVAASCSLRSQEHAQYSTCCCGRVLHLIGLRCVQCLPVYWNSGSLLGKYCQKYC